MRGGLTDARWARLSPLLPPQKPAVGRPAKDHRTVVGAILWVLRTGAPWRDLPADVGVPWRTAASRFYRWTASGVWQKVLAELQREAEKCGVLDRSKYFVDGSSVRAHQHAAGARGSTQEDEALGRSRGGFTTKFHVRAEGNGKPLTLLLSAGQRHESKMFEPLMEKGGVRGAGGSPCTSPGCVVGDKDYSHVRIHRYLARRGIAAVIPLRSDQGHDPGFDRETYRQRNKVERLIGRLKQWRRIATRYEKRAANYLAMLTLASIVLWLWFADAP